MGSILATVVLANYGSGKYSMICPNAHWKRTICPIDLSTVINYYISLAMRKRC